MQEKHRSEGLRRWIIAGMVILVLLVSAYFIFVPQGKANLDQQPINFPHKTMVQAGITCVFCHNTALKSPAAGMPSLQLCMGCHQVIDPAKPEIQQLKGFWDRQEPIPWKRVNQLQRFVYFSHQAHVVSGGINCETCHGDVSNMGVAVPVVNMNMGWCLDCHEKQPNADQLKDCIVCHK